MAVTLNPLDKKALRQILSEPKNAIIKQYKKLMAMDGVALDFTDEAMDMIVEEAQKRKTGARALRAIVEEVMLDVMYEAPSHDSLTECLVTEEWLQDREDTKVVDMLLKKAADEAPQDEIA